MLSFHLKVKVVENLISSGIEDHTFGPMNLRERFPEEELTLGKNRFLEVASLVECDFFHFPNKIQGNTRMVSICHQFENIVQNISFCTSQTKIRVGCLQL